MCASSVAVSASSVAETPLDRILDAGRRDAVLVVDDNDFVAGLMTCLLEREGWRVLRARTGAAAAREFSAHAPEIALAIVDCRLPDTEGPSLGRALRQQDADLPVLLTSGQNYVGPRSLADGPTAFLAKPFLPADFRRQIEQLVGAIA